MSLQGKGLKMQRDVYLADESKFVFNYMLVKKVTSAMVDQVSLVSV